MRRSRTKIRPVKNFSKLLRCCSQWLLMTFLFTTLFGVSTIRSDSAKHPSIKAFNTRLEDLSSVDYFACCGLGHRLIRMSLAHYVAKVKGFALRTFWGWCGEQAPIEVFSYLFEPQPEEELRHVQTYNTLIPFYNEVPGFVALGRNPNSSVCACHQDKIDADLEMYTSLRKRFRDRDRVDSYVRENFRNRTVIGIHVRAGNGEGGDFVRKGRTIDNPRVWVKQVSDTLRSFLEKEQPSLPPVLYVATDTPSMVSMFRRELKPAKIQVLECPQSEGRKQEGQGVLFGVSDQVHNKDGDAGDDYSSCLMGWTNTMTDMFLLSHADVVVAAKPSSFSQTAPMSLAFGNRPRKLSKAYCEVIPGKENITMNTTDPLVLQCYDSYHDWCCNFPTWISFKHPGRQGHERVYSKEFVRFLRLESLSNFSKTEYRAMRHRASNCPRPRRGRAGGGLKDKCLPHRW
jgi:Nodulation protein Z (NodZ)